MVARSTGKARQIAPNERPESFEQSGQNIRFPSFVPAAFSASFALPFALDFGRLFGAMLYASISTRLVCLLFFTIFAAGQTS